jgi:hypothetical protein
MVQCEHEATSKLQKGQIELKESRKGKIRENNTKIEENPDD